MIYWPRQRPRMRTKIASAEVPAVGERPASMMRRIDLEQRPFRRWASARQRNTMRKPGDRVDVRPAERSRPA